ncbi:type II toxin-antitoxin system HicA family toxin [Acidisarcina polymorpha]|uniref:type II toxin-antitoxin system HicA family toxin n=1 Tax=Acidisarcina polymorpha TaxID=2211140 RepID=UPI0039C864F8
MRRLGWVSWLGFEEPEAIKLVEADGLVLEAQKGSHMRFRHPDKAATARTMTRMWSTRSLNG